MERQTFKKSEWPPKLAIALLRSRLDETYGHAVVVKEGQVIDPAHGQQIPAKVFPSLLEMSGRKITSLIVVTGRRY